MLNVASEKNNYMPIYSFTEYTQAGDCVRVEVVIFAVFQPYTYSLSRSNTVRYSMYARDTIASTGNNQL